MDERRGLGHNPPGSSVRLSWGTKGPGTGRGVDSSGRGESEISMSGASSRSGKDCWRSEGGLGGGEGLLHALSTLLARMMDGSVQEIHT